MAEQRLDDPQEHATTRLQCRACGRGFAFEVRFCPFCSVAQRTAPPAASVKPAVPPPPAGLAATAVPAPPRPAAPPAPAKPPFVPPPPPQAVPVPPPARTPKPARAPAPARPVRPARARRKPGGFWRWAAALVGLWALLHLRPPGHRPAQASLTVTVYPDVAGSITVDGAPAGQPGETLRLAAGWHSVGFLSADWLATPRRVDVDATQPSSIALRLQHKARRFQETPERPARTAAPPAAPVPLPAVTAYDWTTRQDIEGAGKLCGVGASINGGTLLLFGGSEKPATLRLLLHKNLWHIPGLTVPVIIAFTDGPTFTFQAQGSGADIAADIPAQDVHDFIHHFTADRQATLTLENGRELPWTLDLRGTSPTITAMAKCLEAAQLWLPPPFTQPGG